MISNMSANPSFTPRRVSTREFQQSLNPETTLQLLREGNERFVSGNHIPYDFSFQIERTAKGQFPFAVILGCIDSRVPHEIVFDQGAGDLFSIRIAGNFINEDILGSMEFACQVAGAKLIVVMGHTGCGAVQGACDEVRLGHLTEMLQKLRPAVDATPTAPGEERSSRNAEFVNRVAQTNVQLTLQNILERSEVLRRLHEEGKIGLVGAMYDVASGRVEFGQLQWKQPS